MPLPKMLRLTETQLLAIAPAVVRGPRVAEPDPARNSTQSLDAGNAPGLPCQAAGSSAPTASAGNDAPVRGKQVKPKTCKACGGKFQPVRPLQVICRTESCIVIYFEAARVKREAATAKKAAKAHKAAKDKAKTITEWLDYAQPFVNRYIRLRDAGKPCISCGTTANVQYAAGHYRTRKAANHLRFHPDNIFLQCNRNCNCGKSGNAIEMRKGMIERIGVERVEAIENDNRVHRWTVEEVKQVIAQFKKMTKEIETA